MEYCYPWWPASHGANLDEHRDPDRQMLYWMPNVYKRREDAQMEKVIQVLGLEWIVENREQATAHPTWRLVVGGEWYACGGTSPEFRRLWFPQSGALGSFQRLCHQTDVSFVDVVEFPIGELYEGDESEEASRQSEEGDGTK